MVCAYLFILICSISYLSYFFLWYNQEMNWGLWINVLNGSLVVISVYSLSNSVVDNGCMRVIILNFSVKGVKWWSWGKGMKENMIFNTYVNLQQGSFFQKRGRKRTPANFFSTGHLPPSI